MTMNRVKNQEALRLVRFATIGKTRATRRWQIRVKGSILPTRSLSMRRVGRKIQVLRACKPVFAGSLRAAKRAVRRIVRQQIAAVA